MAQDDVKTERARSWVVAACCCFVNLTFYGVSRLSGIMLVTATHTFQVSRARAAVPFSLCTAIRNLAGVFVGHLGHRFGVSAVVATGCFLASVGSGLCFFAQDINWLTVCWGTIFGFGFGLSTCLLPLAINRNFGKHNGTASGISYSGAYLGSFIFPPIVLWLMESFGMQGTFLVISGAVLNVLVAALLLREPKSRKKRANASSDAYSDSKEISVICTNSELGEMWKENINRAFLDSQINIRDGCNKSYSKPNDSSANGLYLRYDNNPAHFRSFSEDEILSKSDISNTSLHCDTHHHSNSSNLFRNFKFESTISSSKEFEKIASTEITSPSYLFSSEKDHVPFQNTKSTKNTNVASAGGTAKEIPAIPKTYFRRLLENRLCSKGKCKAKYKLKLQKLRRKLETCILNDRNSVEHTHSDNVKLTSFKYLQSFLQTNLSIVCVPNQYFYLSPPHSVREKQIVTVTGEDGQPVPCGKFITHVEIHSSTKEIPPAIKIMRTEPSLSDSLNRNDKSLPFSGNIHDQSIPPNNNDNSIKSLNCLQLPALANEVCDDSSSNKSSIYDDISSTCKTEDSQSSSFYDHSSSSESFLRGKRGSRRKSSTKYPKSTLKVAINCCLDLFQMLRQPMFMIIGFTMSIQTFILVSVVTTIEDFAKDVSIPENETHYVLMTLSVSNLFGTLGLGSITDRGFISRHRFLSLCFLGMSLCLVTLPVLANSLPSMLSLVAIYGILESGVIITLPILIKQFVKGEKRQTVAIASSNVLSAPTVMLVPWFIGVFRDDIGSYAGLFYLLGGTSLICCLLWLLAPSIRKRRNLKKKAVLNINGC